jgi:hypothetical protein
MKRNVTLAVITAAVLIGGGSYTAFATGDDNPGGTATATPAVSQPAPSHDATDDHGGDRTPGAAPATKQPTAGNGMHVTASEAAAAALKKYPGVLSSVERANSDRWEVKLLGKDNLLHELYVSALTGKVTPDRDHHGGGRPTAGTGPRTDDRSHDLGDDHGGDRDRGDDHGGHDVGDDHGGDRHGGDGRHGGDDN